MPKSIIKTGKYSIYPNNYVYMGTKLILTLTDIEEEFLMRLKNDKRNFYIENPSDLKSDAIKDREKNKIDFYKRQGRGFDDIVKGITKNAEEFIDCYHSYRYAKSVNGFSGIGLFYCTKCLDIQQIKMES